MSKKNGSLNGSLHEQHPQLLNETEEAAFLDDMRRSKDFLASAKPNWNTADLLDFAIHHLSKKNIRLEDVGVKELLRRVFRSLNQRDSAQPIDQPLRPMLLGENSTHSPLVKVFGDDDITVKSRSDAELMVRSMCADLQHRLRSLQIPNDPHWPPMPPPAWAPAGPLPRQSKRREEQRKKNADESAAREKERMAFLGELADALLRGANIHNEKQLGDFAWRVQSLQNAVHTALQHLCILYGHAIVEEELNAVTAEIDAQKKKAQKSGKRITDSVVEYEESEGEEGKEDEVDEHKEDEIDDDEIEDADEAATRPGRKNTSDPVLEAEEAKALRLEKIRPSIQSSVEQAVRHACHLDTVEKAYDLATLPPAKFAQLLTTIRTFVEVHAHNLIKPRYHQGTKVKPLETNGNGNVPAAASPVAALPPKKRPLLDGSLRGSMRE